MTGSRTFGVLISILTAVALVGSAGASAASPAAGPPAKKPAIDIEARRVDRVPTPVPTWFDCSSVFGPGNECATVDLPLDYDEPTGATTSVAILRHKATDQAHKIGSLFVNPGGPGGSGVEIAAAAAYFVGPEVLASFDVVGFDPRGTNYSDNVRCWKDVGVRSADLAGLSVAFPFTAAEKSAYVQSSKAFGRACSTTGKPLSGSMSTAEVARDMDVLRRAVGDTKLTYLGFSYGTYLGNVYANMFPDRVRAMVIDGVLDPIGWAGTKANESVPQTARIKSGEGAARALNQILARCGTAGPEYCNLAAAGDPAQTYDQIIAALQATPLVITDPDTGQEVLTLTYATLISFLLGDMYAPDGASSVDSELSYVLSLLQPSADPGTAAAATQLAARTALVTKVRAAQAHAQEVATTTAEKRAVFGYAFPYDNSPESFQSVLCTDGLNPAKAEKWIGYADTADQSAPGFGPLWTWASAPCASKTWTVRDEDAFTGPFTRSTTNPVLVVGNYWDPATNYDSAVKVASLLPNSRLLSSDSWGHTAFGTSACVTGAMESYVLTLTLPAAGTVCVGDSQPFTTPLQTADDSKARARASEPNRLPPVVPPLPGALPRS